ncbi:glycosyltransferase involved in cell wall biosynthesis [Constrictibacter sp. MBR-5]|jgi:glycosyltransferase involved in cell wall biosynthesis|uniref:glycosyltransferase family 4 protein n=1 Tax=Constrictibacter sp. MBR-5 TaxID=3156467 RepID=UPI00339755DD
MTPDSTAQTQPLRRDDARRLSLAYLAHPHHGGTYMLFRSLRAGLVELGVDLRWIGVGEGAWNAWTDPHWQADCRYGAPVGPRGAVAEGELAGHIASAIVAGDYDGVLVGVLTREAEMLAVTRLPPHVARIMIVHNITPGTYAAARALRDAVHATVAISPRIERDLVGRHGFRRDRCVVIGHGVALGAPPRPRAASRDLRILSLGRIDEAAKGVLWLPRIMRRLGEGHSLTVAGDGPDLARLRSAAADLTDRVAFLGMVAPDDVPALYAAHDVLLVPSRYEGFCLTIAEAMAAGCIPVASHIAGVTDALIRHGRDGILFPVGDVAAAVAALRRLCDPALKGAMSRAARAHAVESFSLDRMTDGYRAVLQDVLRAPPAIASSPLAAMPKSLIRQALPTSLKNALRVVRERVA